MKPGMTGVFCSDTNPRTNDCFWHGKIIQIEGDKLLVEIEDGRKGWIDKKDFTPMYMRREE